MLKQPRKRSEFWQSHFYRKHRKLNFRRWKAKRRRKFFFSFWKEQEKEHLAELEVCQNGKYVLQCVCVCARCEAEITETADNNIETIHEATHNLLEAVCHARLIFGLKARLTRRSLKFLKKWSLLWCMRVNAKLHNCVGISTKLHVDRHWMSFTGNNALEAYVSTFGALSIASNSCARTFYLKFRKRFPFRSGRFSFCRRVCSLFRSCGMYSEMSILGICMHCPGGKFPTASQSAIYIDRKAIKWKWRRAKASPRSRRARELVKFMALHFLWCSMMSFATSRYENSSILMCSRQSFFSFIPMIQFSLPFISHRSVPPFPSAIFPHISLASSSSSIAISIFQQAESVFESFDRGKILLRERRTSNWERIRWLKDEEQANKGDAINRRVISYL